MLSVLIEGTLTAAPIDHTDSVGNRHVSASLRTIDQDGNTFWLTVIAFAPAAKRELKRLDTGDAVAVTGCAALLPWKHGNDQNSRLKVTATRVLTVYEAGQRRKAAGQARAAGAGDDQ